MLIFFLNARYTYLITPYYHIYASPNCVSLFLSSFAYYFSSQMIILWNSFYIP